MVFMLGKTFIFLVLWKKNKKIVPKKGIRILCAIPAVTSRLPSSIEETCLNSVAGSFFLFRARQDCPENH